MIKYFEKNKLGRDFFVGDIHGCFYKLQDAMNAANFNEKTDRIFSVGDLVDRGLESIKAIEWIEKPFFHAVQGNHEDMAIRFPYGNMDTYNYSRNGGDWMINIAPDKQMSVSAALSELPYMLEIDTDYGKIGVIHAEAVDNDWLRTKSTMDKKASREQMLWGREKIQSQDAKYVSGIDYLMVGHTPLQQPTRLGNVFYIDTGACFGKELTFLPLESFGLNKLLDLQT